MTSGSVEIQTGFGFEGELSESFIDSVLQRIGIEEAQEKSAYCFGPGNGEEIIALGKRFKSVRACEAHNTFFARSREKVAKSGLENVVLVQGDAIQDLTSQQDSSIDLVTLFGFGPSRKFDSHKVKQALIAANKALTSNGRIIITSDNYSMKYLQEQTKRIFNNEGEMRMITVEGRGIPLSMLVLQKIEPSGIQNAFFPPFSFLERVVSLGKLTHTNPQRKNIITKRNYRNN